MKTILVGLAALLACSTAWADGQILRWDRVAGVAQEAVGIEVAGIPTSARGVTISNGRAMFNLTTGFLLFEVTGLSYDRHYPLNGRPIGTYPSGSRMVTIVCDSTGMYGTPEVVDTPSFRVLDGDASHRGFITVPTGCRERPEQIVLLLRIADPGPRYGQFLAWGAARSIR